MFDETLAKAKEVAAKGQIRLQHTIERYEKEGEDKKHPQSEKNDFYMYMKREITNHLNHTKGKQKVIRR